MTKYLSMNGTSDWLSIASGNKIVLDILIPSQTWTNYYSYGYITAGTYNLKSGLKTGGTLFLEGTTQNLLINGVSKKTGDSFVFGQRITWEVSTSSSNFNPTIFTYNNGSDPSKSVKGNIYDIKVYDYATNNLIAHYDMSTGTVNDQSGNGNNATLYGGTWLDDGTGATGTPVTYTYDTKQSIYANIQSNYDTKQSIYSNQSTNFDTKQSIYKPINQSYDTKQAIYKAIQELFDTEQVFTQAFNQVSYTYDMKIQQYKDIQESLDTKQAYYTDISVDLDTKQVIYKEIHNLYDTLIQIRNTHDETLYGTLTIQRVIEHRLTINKRRSDDLQIERVLNHILRV